MVAVDATDSFNSSSCANRVSALLGVVAVLRPGAVDVDVDADVMCCVEVLLDVAGVGVMVRNSDTIFSKPACGEAFMASVGAVPTPPFVSTVSFRASGWCNVPLSITGCGTRGERRSLGRARGRWSIYLHHTQHRHTNQVKV